MKKIKLLALLISLILSTQIIKAQDAESTTKPASPKWVSDKGFWVIESNVKNRKSSVVRFYTNDQQLIYTEKIEGVTLNVKKKKTLIKLKNVLDKVVDTWQANGIVKEQGELLAALK